MQAAKKGVLDNSPKPPANAKSLMYELILQTHFAAAHNLREYEGSCERLHGHNWQVDVVLRAEKLDKLGMVMDFRDLKALVNNILDGLDHRYLNELPHFETVNPTTENVARWIFEQLGAQLPDGIRVYKITAWESEKCGASYMEPELAHAKTGNR